MLTSGMYYKSNFDQDRILFVWFREIEVHNKNGGMDLAVI